MTGGLSLLGALGIGLLGSVHCVAMCGGIAGAIALGLPSGAGALARARLLATVGAGRILGYAAAGVLAGGFGLGLAGVLGAHGPAVLRIAAGLILLAIALVVGGISRVPLVLEQLGTRLWRRIAPLAGGLGGASGGVRAVLLGFVWGWVPCGLVYAALGWAATAGGPVDGALVMVAFGLGTLPATVLTGAAAARLGRVIRAVRSRRLAAALLGAFALWTVAAGALMVTRAGAAPSCHGTAVGTPLPAAGSD